MRKLLFIVLLLASGTIFSQEKVHVGFPEDSVFQIHDSLNKLPFVQINYFPIAQTGGKYINGNDYRYLTLAALPNVGLNLNYKRFSLNLVYHSSPLCLNYPKNITNLNKDSLRFRYKDHRANLLVKFKSLKSVNDHRMTFRVAGDGNVRKYKKRITTLTFHDFSGLLGLSKLYRTSINSVEVSHIYTDMSNQVEHYRVTYFRGSEQWTMNAGFNYNRLKQASVKGKNTQAHLLSNLNVYAYLTVLLRDNYEYLTVNDVSNSIGYYESESTVIYNDRSIDPKKYTMTKPVAFRCGLDYQFSGRNSFWSYITGVEFGWMNKVQNTYVRNEKPGAGYVRDDFEPGEDANFFFRYKVGCSFHLRNWKKK